VFTRSRLLKALPVVLAAAVAGGYFATRSEPQRGLSPDGTADEFRAEAAGLELAPGWTWPAQPVAAVADDGRGIMYEKGWGRQAADYYWYCSWASRTLDPRLAEAERRAALGHVLEVRTTYYFKTALAPVSRPAFEEILMSAEQGDVRKLRRDYELNCPHGAESG
jgi:hypothetical protein